MNRQEVDTVYLQTATTWAPYFQSQTTLSKEKTPSLKMFLDNGHLYLEADGRTGVIPSANVKIALLKTVPKLSIA